MIDFKNRRTATVYTFCVFTLTLFLVSQFIIFPLMGINNHKPEKTANTIVVSLANNTIKPVYQPQDPTRKSGASSNYWTAVEDIESKNGKLLYRPGDTSCAKPNKRACGHHQLTFKALKDIGCTTPQCFLDRENYQKSLAMSKQFKRKQATYGCAFNEPHKKYLSHQQGCRGIKTILKAQAGKSRIPRDILKNMANNSMYSYRQLKQLGHKKAAKAFLYEWRSRWQDADNKLAES